MSGENDRLTLRRLEVPVNKFIKVAIPTDLERLQKHHSNILKFQQLQQWDKLHDEHINAIRTVQQLRAKHERDGKLCGRVRVEDAASLEKMMRSQQSPGNLEEDLRELGGLVTEFSLLVHSQQEQIDNIEDNVNMAAANVEEGTRSLGKAVGYKLAVLPLAGALLGGVIAGPLGLLAGFKAAGVAAAVGGGALGFAGGTWSKSIAKPI
ncbi:hypothetical protein WMY93_025561 [Mugilogobius chulae]|uniref:t-SNARE coiled-coil homology domain-containing protein n=1 Tax=Mugilogobius chulae TaxID=88201 RepID=A0AAW0N0Q4_9GOBI